jgi:hypothetical protein
MLVKHARNSHGDALEDTLDRNTSNENGNTRAFEQILSRLTDHY